MKQQKPFHQRTWVRVSFAVLAVAVLMYGSFLVGSTYAVWMIAGVLQQFPASLCVVDTYGTTIKPMEKLFNPGDGYMDQVKAYAENRCYEEYAINRSVNSTWVGSPG